MRLSSIRVNGKYKGLKDQYFDFRNATDNIIAFIGLNGSGKSQLLELVAEVFSYLERCKRDDFRVRGWFGFSIELEYTIQEFDSVEESKCYLIRISENGQVEWRANAIDEFTRELKLLPLPSHVIGYSSGLNENLQRSFMKNAVQYMDAMNAKRAWERRFEQIKANQTARGKLLTERDLELYDSQIESAYSYYQRRYSGIFPELDGVNVSENPELGIRATPVPMMKYLDHDATCLLLISLAILGVEEQKNIFNQGLRFNHIGEVVFKYDLRGFTHDPGAILDIARLIECIGGAGSEYFSALSKATTDEFYDQYELDYLVGEIRLSFSDLSVQERIRSAFTSPEVLFDKLFRIHLLGAEYWSREMKLSLRSDGFDGSVKKPQKWKAPILVEQLSLLDDSGHDVSFEDLSDGEAQLVQVIAMAAVFKDSRTLFLLDEPETHLNPSWRAYFHQYINIILNTDNLNKKVHVFISTHSPFMISSLKKENVFFFQRTNGFISMQSINAQTYGASFDVLIKQLFGLRSLISQTAVEEIKEHLDQDGNMVSRLWIQENLGESMEKAYLLRKLGN
jgi:predicted ATPase